MVESGASVSDDLIQRVWAYLTVKQLLDKELQLSGPEKEQVKKEALRLSLKYSFVTPLTSMVVTKPLGETIHVLHKPKESEAPQTTKPTARQSISTPRVTSTRHRSDNVATTAVERDFERWFSTLHGADKVDILHFVAHV